MVEEVTMYRVVCDRCGKRDESDEYAAWADREQAIYSAEASEWLIRDNGHWCWDCTIWDEEADEDVPNPVAPGVTGGDG